MEETILTILVVFIISLGIFGLIKLVCKPIKTTTAILLVVPTVVTCGIALFLYKSYRFTGFSGKKTFDNKTYSNINFNEELPQDAKKKKENKKAARAFTDVSGKTMYYDEKGDLIGASIKNGYGKEVFTDEKGDYVAESFNNGLGQTMYKDKDGNITTSTTDYLGEENFQDGTKTKTDSNGNKYYS